MTLVELIQEAKSRVLTEEMIVAVLQRMEISEERSIQKQKVSDDFMSRKYKI